MQFQISKLKPACRQAGCSKSISKLKPACRQAGLSFIILILDFLPVGRQGFGVI